MGRSKAGRKKAKTAERGDVALGAWGPREDPKATKFKLCHPVTPAIELLNVPHGKS